LAEGEHLLYVSTALLISLSTALFLATFFEPPRWAVEVVSRILSDPVLISVVLIVSALLLVLGLVILFTAENPFKASVGAVAVFIAVVIFLTTLSTALSSIGEALKGFVDRLANAFAP